MSENEKKAAVETEAASGITLSLDGVQEEKEEEEHARGDRGYRDAGCIADTAHRSPVRSFPS